MAAHSPFRNAAVEAILWAVWRTAAAAQYFGSLVARVLRRVFGALQRGLELLLADLLADSEGRAREHLHGIAVGIPAMALAYVGWLTLR